MRYALILAGGAGVRLWPMSRRTLPKQLIPFLNGKCLLETSVERLSGLIPADCQFICAGEAQRSMILQKLPNWAEERFLGEPTGRDTLNAIGLGAAVMARKDPEAILAVFTADHLIEPVDLFQQIVRQGYTLVERQPEILVTFGIQPDNASTSFGYLELGEKIDSSARRVRRFHEKPGEETAQKYFTSGPEHYLWNSGMFVWKASTLLACIRRYEPATHASLIKIAQEWGKDTYAHRLEGLYPSLKKISIDYAVMEPASRDENMAVASIAMPLRWLDVGSWPAYASVCRQDQHGNALAANKIVLQNAEHNLIVSEDPDHLIAVLGAENLTIIHTRDVTLVCDRQHAETIKKLYQNVGDCFGEEFL